MNTFKLSRAYYDFAVNNPDKCKPIHGSLYHYIICHNNKLGWAVKFGLPTDASMVCISVKNYKTYIKALNDLSTWGFITIHERSKNQWTSNIISLVLEPEEAVNCFGKKYQSTTQSTTQSTAQLTTQSTAQLSASINKPLNLKTLNYKTSKEEEISIFELITNDQEWFTQFCMHHSSKFNKSEIEEFLKKFQASVLDDEPDLSMHDKKKLRRRFGNYIIAIHSKSKNTKLTGKKPKKIMKFSGLPTKAQA